MTIEAKLYLHGDYQTETLGQATIGAQSPDPDLAGEIATMTHSLISYAESEKPHGGTEAEAHVASVTLPWLQ